MADFKIGANLYADTAGRYYSLNGANKAYQESPFEGTQKKITELYDAQKKNQLAALQQQRQKAVSGFNQQKADLRPQYQNQRNQADVTNAQSVAKLRELMAANGINASGENLTTQAQMASSRQSALGDINNNEQTAMRAIDTQIADANDISKDQAITNDIEAKRSEAMLNAYQNWLQDVYQKEKEWKAYEEQQAAAAAAAREAASRRSGGRRSYGRRSSGSSGGSGSNSLSDAYQQYQAQKNQPTVVDQYYNAINKSLNKGRSVVAKPVTVQSLYQQYGLKPQSIANNKNLSAWQKMKLMGG